MAGLERAFSFSGSASVERGVPFHIATDKKGILYAVPSGRFALIRSTADPTFCLTLPGHEAAITAARISPDGTQCATGDAEGNIKVTALKIKNPPASVTYEAKPLQKVNDFGWSDDGTKLLIAGEGSPAALPINAGMGTTVGTLTGHTGAVTTTDFRPERPFRACTGGDDGTLGLHEGPPFKVQILHVDQNDSKTVVCARYSPDGTLLASVSQAGGKIWLNEGKTGEKVRQIPISHKGSVYDLAWSKDGAFIATCGADKTVQCYKVADGERVYATSFGSDIPFMQNGVFACAESGCFGVVGLSGAINFVDASGAIKSGAAVGGHRAKLVGIAPCKAGDAAFVSGSFDGAVVLWGKGGVAADISTAHTKQQAPVTPMYGFVACDDMAVAVGTTGVVGYKLDGSGAVKISEAKGKCAASLTSTQYAVATSDKLLVFEGSALKGEAPLGNDAGDATAIGAAPGRIVVGFSKGAFKSFAFDGATVTLSGTCVGRNRSGIRSVAVSFDGAVVATGDSGRGLFLSDAKAPEALVREGMSDFHNGVVAAVAFSPDGSVLYSAGSELRVWDVATGKTTATIKDPHPDGVLALAVSSDGRVLSVGGAHDVAGWQPK